MYNTFFYMNMSELALENFGGNVTSWGRPCDIIGTKEKIPKTNLPVFLKKSLGLH